MTFAHFLPIPGRVVNSSIVCGTSPWNCSTTPCAKPTICFALLRYNPRDAIYFSTSFVGALANSYGDGYALNNAGVTRLTDTSVVCAERITATDNS